jgi:hypothetical protein
MEAMIAREVARPGRKLDDDVVDGTEFNQRRIHHLRSPAPGFAGSLIEANAGRITQIG